jgi:hypothetical protein
MLAIANGIQLFGGIVFMGERSQISVRRAKLGEVMFGSAGTSSPHREGGVGVMNLNFPSEVEAACRVLRLVDENPPAETTFPRAKSSADAAVGP